MTPKYQRNDHPFFAKFKNWVIANQGSISDRLYTRDPGGLETRGVVIEPPGPAMASALFIHGTGNDLTYPAIALYKALFAEKIRICAFDLDGHGHRGSSLFEAQSIRSFTSWALAQLSEQARKRLFIIGHSLGGSLALAHAAEQPGLISGLILISSPVTLTADSKGLVAEMQSVIRPAVQAELANYGLWGLIPAIGPFKRRTYPIRLKNSDQNYVAQVTETISGLKLREQLHSISYPALLIYGTGDHLVREDNADLLNRNIRNSELVLIRGATHFSTILEPEVPERICSFIRNHAQ